MLRIEKYYQVLLKCQLFRDIDTKNYKNLLSCLNAYIKKYSSNQYVYFAGNQVNYVGIVLTGTVEILKENPAGARYILSFLEPSKMFGESIVCTSNRISPVTVRIKENAHILFIPYERIIKTCANSCMYHIQIIRNTMMILGESNLDLNYKIELLMLKGIREKLAYYLLNESYRQNSLTLQLLPNRNELAEYINVSRTSMCRELGRMKEEGMIDYYRNTFRILAIEELKDCL